MAYILILIFTLLILGLTDPKSAGFGQKKDKRKYLSFFCVFLFLSFWSAIRDDCGCDYYSYVNHITNIQAGLPNYMEPGFQFTIWQLSEIDDNPRLVIIVFGVLTCFFYLLAIWNQSTNRSLSVFIFLSWGYYFMTFNTIRNYFALSVVLCTFPLLVKGRNTGFVLLVLFAALFHKSALLCLPLYYIAKKITFKKKHILPILMSIFLLLSLQTFFRSYVFILYPTYEGSAYDTGRISYLNIIKALLVIAMYIKYRNFIKNDSLAKLYFNLNVIALMIYSGVYWLPEVSRVGFYMNASVLFLIPRIIDSINIQTEKKKLKLAVYLGSILLFGLLLIQFSSETTRLLPYQTWLFDGSYNKY